MEDLIRGAISSEIMKKAAQEYGTPLYLYDENEIIQRCKNLLNMPNAYGIKVSYSVKANSSRALLQLIVKQGLNLDLSSLNEGKRAHLAGISYEKMMLTTQEVPTGQDKRDLEKMMKQGMKYTACSLRQLELIVDFASQNKIPLAMRVHPGVGSGETQSRDTGSKYACFGIHLSDIPKALAIAKEKNVLIETIHVHIGSGGDPKAWRDNIDRELEFVETYFPDVTTVNLGGGFRVARMPDEKPADVTALGNYAKQQFEKFYEKTGRKCTMEIEPGSYIVANSGYLVTTVLDKKRTGDDGFDFVILDGGMEVNVRPAMYGSRHPFYVVSKEGELLSSEMDLSTLDTSSEFNVVGKCCESGDSQSLDRYGTIIPRIMAAPNIDDFVVIGDTGAYCSSMTPFNYNSHTQIPEILLRKSGRLDLIRKRETLEEIIRNEENLQD